MPRVVYGINPVKEALRAHPERVVKLYIGRSHGKRVMEILDMVYRYGIPVESVPGRFLEEMAGTIKHQGVVAELKPYSYASLSMILESWRFSGEKAFILILDSIQDPQNLGSLIRTAHCAGVHGVIIPKDRASQVTPAAVKASAGAVEHTPVARVTNLARTIEDLKREGIWVVGTDSEATRSIYEVDLDMDLAIVVGSEGKGLRPLVRRACDLLVSLPLKGRITSLNASVAGGIVMYEVLRRRLKG